MWRWRRGFPLLNVRSRRYCCGTSFSSEDLAPGSSRAGHLSMLWTDGNRVKDIAVVKWVE